MIGLDFPSPLERRELEARVRIQREDHGVARCANAIFLLDDGKCGQAQMTLAPETELCAWLDGRFCNSAAPIMAHITAQLLAKIKACNPDKRLIHVIWDHAAYHKGPDVLEFFARPDCRIHLIQLPSYCPHFNSIERLWAVMHQYVTHNRHYLTQKQFANAILKIFRETLPNEWQSFRSQVSDSFRVVTHEAFQILK